MHRLNLNSLTAGDRTLLASLILQYATPDIINLHWEAAQAGAHSDPVYFLTFHRNFIAGLETFLLAQGYPQWTPLPAWNPAEPIPREFNIPSTGPGRLRNLNPGVSFSPQFDPGNLSSFADETALGGALLPVHNEVHRRIGGVMNDMRMAPTAPIFWPFHAFIDDIWYQWQAIN